MRTQIRSRQYRHLFFYAIPHTEAADLLLTPVYTAADFSSRH
jgi:hypothetical protein